MNKKRDWIGEYQLVTQELQTYKNKWVEVSVSLGKCLSWDEACEKAVLAIMREFANSKIKETYIVNGWGQIRYM